MRQLTFVEPDCLEWRDVPAPRLQGDGEALVRPIAVGRCDLDVAYVRGAVPIARGEAIGHECIAEIVDLGSAVSNVRIGQKVILSPQICCGICGFCRRGLTGRCTSVPFGASYGMGRAGGYGGAVSDLMRVPFAEAMLVPIPRDKSPAQLIGAADAVLDAWRCVAPALKERPDCAVLVAGGWPARIGLYAAAVAVALGSPRVDYWDEDPSRRAIAESFGARAVENLSDLEPVYGVVVDASANAAALREAIRATEPEGVLTSCTIHAGNETPLPLQDMYWKGITFKTGRPNVRAQMEPVLHFCGSGFDPSIVPTVLAPFEAADEAFLAPAVSVAVTRG